MFYRIGAIALLISAIVAGVVITPTNAQMDDEPTTFTIRIENISDTGQTADYGVFNTPDMGTDPAPAFPGESYEFSFAQVEGGRVSFATMLVQSNDLFFAPAPHGIDLFDADGNPVTGDITDQIYLWDAGTEVNEEPGVGPNQAPRQGDMSAGEDENGVVQVVNDGFAYPAVNELIRVTVEYGMEIFTVRIENISGDSALVSPIAPGFYVVYESGHPLFDDGYADRGEGLEALAEDGNPAGLYDRFDTVLETPFAPGVAVVHTDAGPLFIAGEADRGAGLEALAEDGDPSGLAALDYMGVSSVTIFNTPDMAADPGPLFPGSYYEFTFEAVPGDHLSLATMLVQSNDLFVGTDAAGVALFDADGHPLHGISNLGIWDAGTEVNEEPGVGPNQAPRQGDMSAGEAENGVVHLVADGFNYPSAFNLVRITVYVDGMDMMGDDDMMGEDDMSDDMSDDSMSDDEMSDDMSDDSMSDDEMSDDMSDDSMSDSDMSSEG